MSENNFYSDLADSIRGKNIDNANEVVMKELGVAISQNKVDFIYVLRNAGVLVDDNASDAELVDLFVKNAPINDELLIGVSYFIADKNKVSGLDGESEVSDTGIKATYKVMNGYFGNEGKSNWVGAIAKAASSGADLAGKVVEGRNQKKYGAAIQQGKQRDAANKLKETLLAQRQQEAENAEKEKERSAKLTKILVISGVSLVVIGIGVFAFLKFKKK